MLWLPATPQTTRIFADFFQSRVFSVAPALRAAVHAESDAQGDEEPLSVPVVDWVNPCRPHGRRLQLASHRGNDKGWMDRRVRIDGVGPPPPGPASRAHRKRKQQRQAKVVAEGHTPRPAAYARRAVDRAAVQTALDSEELPVEWGAYRAGMADARELRGSKKARSVDDFLKLGFQVKEWDGMGFYAAITVGISYGQGQTEACSLEAEYPELAEQLVEDSAFQELASFASSMLAFWAPQLYEYYRQYNEKLDPTLTNPRPFTRSVFAAATFNLGPNVWTFKHRDVLNLPFGWCAITALGDFDHTKGGHLVLWDLKLVVQFPAGSTILIPSATLAHSNIPVGKDEHRASFTQYTAGGLFRLIDNGFERRLS
ncbi:hypothetical protein HMN09_01206800 [Mycena chlorophos]|uniref:Uncharacterized protein n=1 Tax=Mycena chlorophos TaxID=658473 RepID=A0A8H6VTF9_MYCCL|nr:hypothetical protein HMN09_01206800 [Mycena chlorophos]